VNHKSFDESSFSSFNNKLYKLSCVRRFSALRFCWAFWNCFGSRGALVLWLPKSLGALFTNCRFRCFSGFSVVFIAFCTYFEVR
jgi:hypothetical protein